MIRLLQLGNNSFCLNLRYTIFLLLYLLICNYQVNAQKKNSFTKVNKALEDVMDKDQNVRIYYDSIFEEYGLNSRELTEVTKTMNRIDTKNQIFIDSIFSKYGWLTPPNVSIKAAKAYFYVIQHASAEFQKKYKLDVIDAYHKNILDLQEYKFFIDRVTLHEGKFQIYGTQKYRDNIGNEYFLPVDTTQNNQQEFSNISLKEGKFPLLGNPNHDIGIFIHTFYKVNNEATPYVDIYLDDEKIGMTNSNGFFQILLPRKKVDQFLKVEFRGKKQTIILKYDENRHYFDQYFAF